MYLTLEVSYDEKEWTEVAGLRSQTLAELKSYPDFNTVIKYYPHSRVVAVIEIERMKHNGN